VYEIVHGVFLQDTYCVRHYSCAVVRRGQRSSGPSGLLNRLDWGSIRVGNSPFLFCFFGSVRECALL
jgi:hypothetical protein